jgi:hypothetical protein
LKASSRVNEDEDISAVNELEYGKKKLPSIAGNKTSREPWASGTQGSLDGDFETPKGSNHNL